MTEDQLIAWINASGGIEAIIRQAIYDSPQAKAAQAQIDCLILGGTPEQAQEAGYMAHIRACH